MANQMIALGVRGAQMPSLAGLTQQYGQVMNVLAQQRASERQAALAQQQIARTQQEMDLAVAKRGEESRAAGQDFDVAEMARLRNLATAVNSEETYQAWLNEVDQVDPRSARMFRQASPGYNPQFMLNVMGEAEDYIRARVPAATAQTMLGAGGGAFNVVAGMPGVATATPVTVGDLSAAGAPAAGAPAAGAPTATATRGAQTGPQDLLDQGIPPSAIPMGNSLQRPIAMTTGGQPAAQPLTMETAAPIIQTAVQSGSIGQNDLQALRQMVGPQMEPQLAQWMQQNNIRITPAGEPSMRSAVYRPGQDAAPQMTQVQSNAPGSQFFGRDPYTSPSQVPSSAGAVAAAQREPIPEAASRAGATTRAEREAEAGTAYARERNTRQAQADVDFMQQYPGAAATVRNNLNVLDRMIGDARVVGSRVTVPRGGRRPHAGFEDVIGMGIPGLRFVPGTSAADFDALFNQVTGAAFLEAFETLKGGGQITEREGQVATQAITRLSRNISEVEFIEAANELRDIMRRGLERAEARAARIEGRSTPLEVSITEGDRRRRADDLVRQYGGQ